MPLRVRSYRDLVVWQRAMSLAEEAYHLAALLPGTERYELASQIRRAAVSIASNIAEGHGRPGTRDYLRFLGIANGSLTELETQLLLANRLHLLPAAELARSTEKCAEVSRMLMSLRKALRRRLPPQPLSPSAP